MYSLVEWASFVIMTDYALPMSDEAERFLESLHDAADGCPDSVGCAPIL